ncbi:phage tail protein [Actinophytocola sp.]|uniref:phage tail protein n=1 Tax=Actinophytocola sp. TaxID=1872138 RepID=UPI002EDB0267
MVNVSAMLGLQTRFKVVVDGVDLGGWSKCTGLAVEFKAKMIVEGGNYEYQPILPDIIEYKPIVLERAMNAQDSEHVQNWLRGKVSSYMKQDFRGGGGGTAHITLCDSHGNKVTSWSLRGVYPAGWDGPELSASTFGIAIEKLKLVHEGFL